ncbi:MAG: archease [Acidimicrobiia bacterium]
MRTQRRSEKEPTAGYRYLPHTADEILEAWGSTERDCASELATGLVAGFVQSRSELPELEAQPFAIELGDRATLEDTLVALLEEVLFVVETEGLVPIRTEVERIEAGRVEGKFYVLPLDAVEETGAVPKAVSYEDLVFEKADGLWRARITIDV